MLTTSLWIAFIIVLVIDFLIAALRASLLNARIPYLVTLRDQDPTAVERTIALLKKPRLRVALRLAVVIVHFLLAGIGIYLVEMLTHFIPNLWQAIGLLALAAVLMLAVEFLLEGMLLPRAEAWALRFSALAGGIDWLLAPLSSVLMRLLGSPAMLENRLTPVTEDELKNWVEEGQSQGGLEQGERRMIYSIFQFGETLAREIMVPRIDVLALEITSSLEDAVKLLTQSGHSRVPVYEDSVDNVIGLLYAKDLLRIRSTDGQTVETVRDLIRPAYFVPEAKKVDELLREMQSRSVHMALIVDEYGGIAGLVTMEDIVEEIVGEIRDEYDQSEELLYEAISPEEYRFQGRIDLDDFNEVMDTNLTKDVADTLGGFIYGQIGRVPAGGEEIKVDDVILRVEQVSGRRIRTVRAIRQDLTPPQTTVTETENEPER